MASAEAATAEAAATAAEAASQAAAQPDAMAADAAALAAAISGLEAEQGMGLSTLEALGCTVADSSPVTGEEDFEDFEIYFEVEGIQSRYAEDGDEPPPAPSAQLGAQKCTLAELLWKGNPLRLYH